MKLLSILSGFFMLIITATCNTQSTKNSQMEITGFIQPIEMSSWQYGTHTLIDNEENLYALKSENVSLVDFENQLVTLQVQRIEGYPVDGGPEFFEVKSIKKR